ncbi:hypothetical protein MferCBS31731_006664 [Microsporum ferrugineum]
MPVTTRKMNEKRRKKEEETYGTIEDRVCYGAIMYPVFCTAKIPSQVLDEFIDESYAGIVDITGEDNGGGSPCILQTTDLETITHGSRKPMPDFESPFLNWTDEQIRDWATKESKIERGYIASSTFTILDENTIDAKVCRVGYISINGIEKADYRMLSEVFYADLMVRVPLEMAEISWDETLSGIDGVYDRKAIEAEE